MKEQWTVEHLGKKLAVYVLISCVPVDGDSRFHDCLDCNCYDHDIF